MDKIYVDMQGRLDYVLSKKLEMSRNQISNLIKNKNVLINGEFVSKPSFLVDVGQEIELILPKKDDEKQDYDFNIDVKIIYEDEDVLVINKPPNLVVHPANSVKEATLVDFLKYKNYKLSSINGDIRAGIVHRLDKETSGIMIVAKTDSAHKSLSFQLKDKSMGRMYLALVDLPLKQNLIIDRKIGRNPSNRLKKAIVKDGRESKSAFVNLYSDENVNLISAKLFTGRTHQIRVHLSSINRHILGDDLYGFKSKRDKISRIMLHSYILHFIHPSTGKRMEFIADLWSDFEALIAKSSNKEKIYEKILPDNISNSFNDFSDWLWLT